MALTAQFGLSHCIAEYFTYLLTAKSHRCPLQYKGRQKKFSRVIMISQGLKNTAHEKALPFALLHHPDVVGGPQMAPIGRHVAGQGMLEGLMRHSGQETLHAVTSEALHADHFDELASQAGWKGAVKHHSLETLSSQAGVGTLMLPGPSLAPYARLRANVPGARHALCGLTHTVATQQMTRELYQLLAAPLLPGDAIICTSKAVRDVVQYQFDHAVETGWAAPSRSPNLPVIPLGIDSDRFSPDPHLRAKWRARLGLGPGDVAVLTLGRLATFEKMHPAPLFLAMQKAAKDCAAPLQLFMCGWFQDEQEEQAHRDMAQAFAPDVAVAFPDGRDSETKFGLLQAADIFAFPVDNIQETFGLAPVEAMAAGLPVVASNWNGLSETIVHGETGFKAATYMAPPSTGEGLAESYAEGSACYLQYLGSVQQRAAIDVRALAEAITVLGRDPEKRRTMGAAARKRARGVYDWSVIVPQLEALWADQAERAFGAECEPTSVPRGDPPPHPNPLLQYRGYASDQLTGSHTLKGAVPMTAEGMLDHIRLTGATVPGFMPVSPNVILRVNHQLARHGPLAVDELAKALNLSVDQAEAAAIWLAKFNFLQISAPEHLP